MPRNRKNGETRNGNSGRSVREIRKEENKMQKIYDVLSVALNWLIMYAIVIIEFIGVAILCYSVFRAVVMIVRKQGNVRLRLAEGIALTLEFKMGGELLRTVIVRDMKELLILGSVILLRVGLTFMIQWEIKNERNAQATEEKKQEDGESTKKGM